MPLKYDYAALRTQYIAAEPPISLRELCRLNDIDEGKSSTIMKRARDEDWDGLRDRRMTRADDKVIEEISQREANRRLRRMQVEDNAVDAIDEAITKMRSDMKRTKIEWTKDPTTQEWESHEVPAVTYRPEQVVQLIDRIKGLFGGGPAEIGPSGDPALAATFNFDFNGDSPEHRALATQLVAATRGAGRSAPGAPGGSPLPTAPGVGADE